MENQKSIKGHEVSREGTTAVINSFDTEKPELEKLIREKPETYFKSFVTAKIKAVQLLHDQIIGDRFSVHIITEGNKTTILI